MRKIIGTMTSMGEIVSQKQNGYYLVKTGPGRYTRFTPEQLGIQTMSTVSEKTNG